MTFKRIALLIIAIAVITGCAPKFSCMETIDGVKCKNLQGVYDEKVTGAGSYDKQATVNPTPKKSKDGKNKEAIPEKFLSEKEAIIQHLEISDPRPIRLPPVVLRIWTSPWEDADGDLHNAGYIYTEVEQRRGRWLFGEEAVKGSSVQNKVFGTKSVTDSRVDQKKETVNSKKEEDITSKYLGQKPPTDTPKLKLSK